MAENIIVVMIIDFISELFFIRLSNKIPLIINSSNIAGNIAIDTKLNIKELLSIGVIVLLKKFDSKKKDGKPIAIVKVKETNINSKEMLYLVFDILKSVIFFLANKPNTIKDNK